MGVTRKMQSDEKKELSIRQKVESLKDAQVADLAALLTRLTSNAVAGTPSHTNGISFAWSHTL
jgi:hypothetical protein